MATKFKPVSLVKGDKTRTAYSQAGLTQAQWDGFAPEAAKDEKAAEALSSATTAAAGAGKPVPTATPPK